MIAAVILCALIISEISADCPVQLSEKLTKQPLVLRDGTLLQPSKKDGLINVAENSLIQFLCSGSDNYIIPQSFGKLQNARCTSGSFHLEGDDRTRLFSEIECHKTPESKINTNGNCELNAAKLQIGYQVAPANFLTEIELCFDTTKLTTYWTRHFLRVSGYSCITSSQNFKSDKFPTNVAKYYLHSHYEKGHLTPKCDFFAGSEQLMTFYYVNAAPQVGTFNRGNWKNLEIALRDGARKFQKKFVVYTGTFKTIKFLDEALSRIPINLIDTSTSTGRGVAFAGVNNITHYHHNICAQDVCGQIQWIDANVRRSFQDLSKGRIYCCSIEDLKDVATLVRPNMAEFTGGLLTDL